MLEIYRQGRHQGEEPPIAGTRGSGTIFFSRCTMRCLYCQNYPWSQEGAGRAHDVAGLVAMLEQLRQAGCHNWNLVSPTPWLPWIAQALPQAWRSGPRLPVVYNTSGYERIETLARIGDWVDIYLADLRYAQAGTAGSASAAPDYVAVARAALRAMWRQTGPLEVDAEGVARRGTICRVLILPGLAEEAVASLEWLAADIGTAIPVSIMAQYTPAYRADGQAPWNRGITRQEYDRVVESTVRLGFERGWIQEFGHPPPEGLLGFTMMPESAGCMG